MIDKLVFISYAVILCVGGVFGWKAGSPISLVMSGISAAPVGWGVFLLVGFRGDLTEVFSCMKLSPTSLLF